MDLSVTAEDVTVSPSSTTDCPAPPTSLLWSNPADLPSTTSAGSGLSTHRTQHNSWSKVWSLPAWTTVTPSWLDSQPPRLNHCSVSRMLQRLVYNLPKFSDATHLLRHLHWLPVAARIWFQTVVLVFKAVNRTAPAYLQTLVSPHGPETALHCSTSAGRLVPPSLRANKAAQQSWYSSEFWSLSGGTNSWPTSGQQSRSLSAAGDSRLSVQTSPPPHRAPLPPAPIVVVFFFL